MTTEINAVAVGGPHYECAHLLYLQIGRPILPAADGFGPAVPHTDARRAINRSGASGSRKSSWRTVGTSSSVNESEEHDRRLAGDQAVRRPRLHVQPEACGGVEALTIRDEFEPAFDNLHDRRSGGLMLA